MVALRDALLVHAPPERPITFDWPDVVRVDGGLIGGGRLGLAFRMQLKPSRRSGWYSAPLSEWFP